MAGYCRICHQEGQGRTDTLVACNSCGSLACDLHHTWWSDSKNAICTECFPLALADALNQVIAGLKSVNNKKDSMTDNAESKPIKVPSKEYLKRINGALERQNLSIVRLVEILGLVATEISKPMRD